VSRAVDESSVAKLVRAISPYVIGGKRLAHLIFSPTVVDFFETVLKKGEESLALEEIAVGPQSPIAGRSLGELRVKACWWSSGALSPSPTPARN
jgi:voltage-gated potassium channel